LCDRGRPKGLSHTDGGRAAGCRHGRVRRIDAGSDAPARRVSRARSLASLSAYEDSPRLVILDGTPALLSRLFAGHGAKSPSRPMAQFWPRASRTYDVGNQRRRIGACDMRRTVKYRLDATVLRALRTQLTPNQKYVGVNVNAFRQFRLVARSCPSAQLPC